MKDGPAGFPRRNPRVTVNLHDTPCPRSSRPRRTPSPRWAPPRRCLFPPERADRLIGIEADRSGHIEVFQDIQTPIAPFVFGDVGRRFTKALRNRRLCQPGCLALRDKQSAKPAMTFGVNGLRQREAVGLGSPSEFAWPILRINPSPWRKIVANSKPEPAPVFDRPATATLLLRGRLETRSTVGLDHQSRNAAPQRS